MKVVKVRIRRGGANENMMVYPARYRAQEVDRCGLGPAILAYSGQIGRGQGEEYCLICIVDGVADVYAKDPNMEIISAEETDRLMTQWNKDNGLPEEYSGDPNRVQAVIAKTLLKIPLSDEDKRAMDPDDDSCMGLNKRRCDIRKLAEKRGHKIAA